MSSSLPKRDWFQVGEGIAREVIYADIARYLGRDATVRPGFGIGDEEGVAGFWIHAHRNLTTAQVEDLKRDSSSWLNERRNQATDVSYVNSSTYASSRGHQLAQYLHNPTTGYQASGGYGAGGAGTQGSPDIDFSYQDPQRKDLRSEEDRRAAGLYTQSSDPTYSYAPQHGYAEYVQPAASQSGHIWYTQPAASQSEYASYTQPAASQYEHTRYTQPAASQSGYVRYTQPVASQSGYAGYTQPAASQSGYSGYSYTQPAAYPTTTSAPTSYQVQESVQSQDSTATSSPQIAPYQLNPTAQQFQKRRR